MGTASAPASEQGSTVVTDPHGSRVKQLPSRHTAVGGDPWAGGSRLTPHGVGFCRDAGCEPGPVPPMPSVTPLSQGMPDQSSHVPGAPPITSLGLAEEGTRGRESTWGWRAEAMEVAGRGRPPLQAQPDPPPSPGHSWSAEPHGRVLPSAGHGWPQTQSPFPAPCKAQRLVALIWEPQQVLDRHPRLYFPPSELHGACMRGERPSAAPRTQRGR